MPVGQFYFTERLLVSKPDATQGELSTFMFSTMQYLFMSMFDRLKINYGNYNIYDNTESYYYYQDLARIQKPDAVQRK